MKQISKYILATFFAGASLLASAQNTATGFYVADYAYRYQMNPAIDNSSNFIAMPALGNLNVTMHGNLHLKSVLFNVDGRTTTFLNPGVSVGEVMNGLHDMNKLGGSFRINLLSAGFKAFGGYNTITLGARADFGVKIPKSVFSLLKEGVENKTYSINDMGVFANAYGELAFGHSHQLTNEIRIGGTLKFLLGGGNISAKFNKAELVLGEDDWEINSNAEINASVKGLQYKQKLNDDTNHEYVNGAKIDGGGLNGFGMGVDLGVTYTPESLNDWSFNLAVLDLGFIGWNNNMVASTQGDKYFNTDRYTFNADDDAPNSFDREKDKIRDDLSALYELDDLGDKGSRTTMLGSTINAGAEYTFPLYRKLTFGLLSTTRLQGDYTWTNFRLSANVAPVKCFDASVSLGMGTFGCSFGWLANLHTKGFNLFVGMDHTVGKLAKQGVPLSSNASFNLGINFPF